MDTFLSAVNVVCLVKLRKQSVVYVSDITAVEIIVPGNHKYQIVPIVPAFKHSFIFKVKMASDVVIGLTKLKDKYDIDDMYEIVIGGSKDTVSLIRSENISNKYIGVSLLVFILI